MVNQLLKQYTLKLKENFLLPLYLQNNGSTCLLYHAEITHTHTISIIKVSTQESKLCPFALDYDIIIPWRLSCKEPRHHHD